MPTRHTGEPDHVRTDEQLIRDIVRKLIAQEEAASVALRYSKPGTRLPRVQLSGLVQRGETDPFISHREDYHLLASIIERF